MFKLHNTIQNYAWGSKTALTELFGIPNHELLPMAEIWMGAHPKSSSKLITSDKKDISLFSQSLANDKDDTVKTLPALNEYIQNDLIKHLGEAAARKFGELPFLFKVLCANEPLSIQVHPSKSAAIKGFERENKEGIPLDSPVRDYKDPNHKPELIYALTDFIAMNAFRTLEDIKHLLMPLINAHPLINNFIESPNEEKLAQLFKGLLELEGESKHELLIKLNHTLKLKLATLDTLSKNHQLTWQMIEWISNIYPDDMGLFAPLLLNVIQLKPGEAMFLYANTPHAYLNGTGLEIMANSDNVLRAGLTPKNINIPELMANLEFIPTALDTLLFKPVKNNQSAVFPIPVEDFKFAIHNIKDQDTLGINLQSANIIFCIKGEILITDKTKTNQISLLPGESCFISLDTSDIIVSGNGVIAQAYY